MVSRAAPSLFRVLAQQRRWSTWEVFVTHFDKAARALVKNAPSTTVRTPSVGRRTFDRWYSGDWYGQPRGTFTCRVLEDMFGFPVEELFRPAPAVLRPTESPLGRDQVRAAQAIEQSWATSRMSLTTASGFGWDTWELAGRRTFDGTSLAVRMHLLEPPDGGLLRLGLDDDPSLQGSLRPAGAGALIGVLPAHSGPELYVMDAGVARSHLLRAPGADALPIPDAYRLDDLTYGLIWAAANLDAALLADDWQLDAEEPLLTAYLDVPRTAPSRSLLPELTAIGSSWVGSSFCAQHIQRKLKSASGTPVFWTREQFGEEAAGWLLWKHKIQYVHALQERFATSAGPSLSRAFCIPEVAVIDSDQYELLLLLLAVACMEMHDIVVHVCDDASMSSLEGFVLIPGQSAIIANWVRAEGLWYADATSARAQLRSYADAVQYAAEQTIAKGDSARERLQALAAYFGVDWTWFTRRCRTLAAAGIDGLVRPRSRLMSNAELETTLRFVGSL